MLYPPLNELTAKVNSIYLKRAREIDENPESALLSKYDAKKPVGKALEEIAGGDVYPDGLYKIPSK